MAGGKDLTYRIDVNASDAVASLRGFETAVKRTMKTVESELDDSATAGDKVSKAMDKLASQMKEDFNSASIAAERLQQALKDAGSGLDVADAIPTLQRMGLSFDEITQDADKLAGSLKQLDDVRMTGVEDLEARAPGLASKLDNVEKSANSSKSALANMIGNSTQSMGQLVGISGDLGVGIGQIGEYFADARLEGEGFGSVIKSFGGIVGPMAALGAATMIMSNAMEAAQASRAFNAENVKQYSQALKDGESATHSLNEEIRATGELQFRQHMGGGFLGMFASTQDLLPILERAGQDVKSFNAIVEQYVKTQDFSGDANDRNRASLEAHGASMLDAIDITKAATDEAKARIKAQQQGTLTTEQLASSEDDLAAKTERAKVETQQASEASDAYNQLLADQKQAAQSAADALNAQIDAMTAAADASIAATDAQAKMIEAITESSKVQGDAKAKTEDKTKAVNDERDAVIDAAKANERLADENAAAAGATRSATEKVDSFNASLIANAHFATPAAQAAIYDYLIQVNNIPEEKATQIRAAVASGDLATAETLLGPNGGVSRARDAAIIADAKTAAAETDLKNLTEKQRTAYINTFVLPPGVKNDKGGVVGPGGGIAAERRPEFVQYPGGAVALLTAETVVPPGTKVTGGTETARILAGAGSGSTTVHVHMPRGSRPDDTVAAIRKYSRRNGGRRARP